MGTLLDLFESGEYNAIKTFLDKNENFMLTSVYDGSSNVDDNHESIKIEPYKYEESYFQPIFPLIISNKVEIIKNLLKDYRNRFERERDNDAGILWQIVHLNNAELCRLFIDELDMDPNEIESSPYPPDRFGFNIQN
jgi:hypothetical protein